MSRDAFFDSVRRAYRMAIPKVVVDSPQIKADSIESALRVCDFWLTPKVVEDYDPKDFADLPLELQNELADAVQTFVTEAAKVPSDHPASKRDRDAAWAGFHRTLVIVRELVTEEWRHAVDAIFGLVEEYSREQGWATKRLEKRMSDAFLGSYALDQLLIHRPDARFLMDPVSRYVDGTTGVIDLYQYPSLGGTMLSQVDGSWTIHSLKHNENPLPWTPINFRLVLDGLVRAAA